MDAIPDFLRATPERTARSHAAVKLLDAKEKAANTRLTNRLRREADERAARRPKMRGHPKALRALGYRPKDIKLITRQAAEWIIVRQTPPPKGS